MNTVLLTPENEKQIIDTALAVLQKGGLVVYPTETTYGVGADCENPEAIRKLLAYKSKRDGKPLSIAVANQKMAERYVRLNETAKHVYKTFLPGPVTVVSTSTGKAATGVASITGTIGIRIPDYPFVLKLLKIYGKGITATGANASYQKRPYTIQDIFDHISQKQKNLIDLVIDAGELPHNEPSTVIDTTLDDIRVFRFGKVPFQSKTVFTSSDVNDTLKIATDLIAAFRSKLTYTPLVFALSGEMGAGKTHFAKGIARGLAMTETVTSPTYTYSNEYAFLNEGREGIFVHIDTWRMDSVEQLKHLHIDSLIKKNAVVVIEWADKFPDEIRSLEGQATVVWVTLEITGEHERRISLHYPF